MKGRKVGNGTLIRTFGTMFGKINEIYNLPDSAKHHVIDKKIMNVSSKLLKTACVCLPDIYGQSTGIGNRATFLVPEYVRIAMEKKEEFYLGKGENVRAVTHIDDVVGLFSSAKPFKAEDQHNGAKRFF